MEVTEPMQNLTSSIVKMPFFCIMIENLKFVYNIKYIDTYLLISSFFSLSNAVAIILFFERFYDIQQIQPKELNTFSLYNN